MSNKNSTSKTQKSQIADLYDRAAPSYDQIGPKFGSHFGRRLVELVHVPLGASVLDVAAGRGACLFVAAEQVGLSGKVVGIDLSSGMVQETTAEIKRRGLQNAEMHLMDAEALRFPDTSFDFLFCAYAIFWFLRPEQALTEFYRVLRPGGKVAISINGVTDKSQWRWYNDLLIAYNEKHSIFVDYGGNNLNRNPTALEALLTQAGFRNLETTTEAAELVYRDADEWWATLWTHGARAPLEQMEPELLAQFKADALSQLASIKEEDGYHDVWTTHFLIGRKP